MWPNIDVNLAAAAHIATGVVSIPTTAGGTEIVPLRPTRRSLTLINTSTTVVYFGAGTVDNTFGYLPGVAGVSIPADTVTQVKGLSASGTVSVVFVETYD